MNHPSPWTSERTDALVDMWPHYSASDVANYLGGGLTRSAVIAKALRIGLRKRKLNQERALRTSVTVDSKPKDPSKCFHRNCDCLHLPGYMYCYKAADLRGHDA